MTILQDVTERDELAARMMQIDRVAALGTLLAGMGHEINNPLSYLANNLEFSLQHLEQLRREVGENRETGLPPEWEERCKAVVEALQESTLGSQRIRDIVSRLREFSRIDDTPRKAIRLEGVLESSIRMADGEIRHRARLVRDFRTVPTVEAHESQIAQVFLNLLINAAHALDEGNSEKDSITVSLFAQDDQVIVEVSDTGSGIPEEVASRIFDPFFTTKPPGQGTGLGLSICQKIVEAHGGLLTFRSTLGEGTTFRVSLKAAERPEDVASTPDLSQPQARRRKLAVIDDDPMVCRGLKRLLESANEVHASTDAQTFLDALDRGELYDVVFCDLMMPGMTGMELHDVLAVRYPEILARTVFMTGGAFTPQAEKFLATLRYPLLLKPFDLGQILDLVARMEAGNR
jgi:nitrogen-specific signal transduction histidine kinase/CheY-like chemotaxis protein